MAYGNIQQLKANKIVSEKLLEIKKDDQSNSESKAACLGLYIH